jgi:hypothetical protein
VAVLVAKAIANMLVLGSHEAEPQMSVRASVLVAMNAATVAMHSGGGHGREA